MNGSINPIYVNNTLQILEYRCFTLLIEGYNVVKSTKNITIDWNEEDISKELILSLQTNKNRKDWNIRVEAEHRLYKNDGVPANKSPRIDFCFSALSVATEWEFFAEAKNLIENDSSKTGRKTKISATSLHKRYIETGINNYVSGKYPSNGCLLGYTLQGTITNIIVSINELLSNNKRQSEQLHFDNSIDCYISKHNELSLKHLMFDFA